MEQKIKAGIVGATGYAGAELVRLLLGHPQAEIAAISSVSFEGKALSDVYPAYYHLCDLPCGTQEEVVEASDVIFAALPHGLSQISRRSASPRARRSSIWARISAWRARTIIKHGTAANSKTRTSMSRRCTACRSCSAKRSPASA